MVLQYKKSKTGYIKQLKNKINNNYYFKKIIKI